MQKRYSLITSYVSYIFIHLADKNTVDTTAVMNSVGLREV